MYSNICFSKKINDGLSLWHYLTNRLCFLLFLWIFLPAGSVHLVFKLLDFFFLPPGSQSNSRLSLSQHPFTASEIKGDIIYKVELFNNACFPRVLWELWTNNRSSEDWKCGMVESLLCDMWAQEHLFIPRCVWDEVIVPRRIPSVCLVSISLFIFSFNFFIYIVFALSFVLAFGFHSFNIYLLTDVHHLWTTGWFWNFFKK